MKQEQSGVAVDHLVIMTVQALDGDVPLGRHRCTMVPLVFFNIVGLKVFMDARWLVTP